MFCVLHGLQVVFVRVMLRVQIMNFHDFWSTCGIGGTFIIFIFLSPSHNFLPFFLSEACSCFLVYFGIGGTFIIFLFTFPSHNFLPFLSFLAATKGEGEGGC